MHILHLNTVLSVSSCRYYAVNYAIIIGMKARYSYRIYPTQGQQTELSKLFGCCRVVWNDSLAWVLQTDADTAWPSNAELQKLCITLAKRYPQRAWLSEVAVTPLQQSVQDLGVAFKNFFEGHAKLPRFKRRDDKQSARFTQRGFSLKRGKLFLSKIGLVKVKWSRKLPAEPSSVTVIKNAAGQYYASFVVEMQQRSIEPLRERIGLDLGIKTFCFPSIGEPIAAPNYLKLNRQIARASRKLARQQKGSNRWQRTKQRLAKLHLSVRNIRKDFLHKLSTKLIRENQSVSIEDLNVSGMVRNRRLARAISQQGWREFRTLLESKASRYVDRQVNVISRWEPTSQVCSSCGYQWGKLDLSVRTVKCVSCGATHDRDQNAAKNIEKSGLDIAHGSKRTMNSCKSGMSSSEIASSSQPYEAKQLTLCF